MEIDILKKAGLTESQAKGYMALIEHGALTPAELAYYTSETRTNAYAIVEKLESLGLATKKKDTKKSLYIAAHPSAVEALAEKRRKIVAKNEQEVKQNISSLIDLFYITNELPGTRTLTGIDGLKSVYEEVLRDKKDLYFIRTMADKDNLSKDFIHNYREKRAELGIHTYGLTIDTESARYNQIHYDKKRLFHRTFLPYGEYTAPVQISIFGDKVAFIAFGDTQMATIINSPVIAEAMRQIFKIITKLIKQLEK